MKRPSIILFPRKPKRRLRMTPARFANIILALILGTLVGTIFMVAMSLLGGCTVDESGLGDAPEDRCIGLTLETCLARVNADGGTD